jgi:hypothetical protein
LASLIALNISSPVISILLCFTNRLIGHRDKHTAEGDNFNPGRKCELHQTRLATAATINGFTMLACSKSLTRRFTGNQIWPPQPLLQRRVLAHMVGKIP